MIKLMGDEENRRSVALESQDTLQALSLEGGIANRQNFIQEQNLRLRVRGDGKTQSDHHSTRVAPERLIECSAQFREMYDVVKSLAYLAPRKTKKAAR